MPTPDKILSSLSTIANEWQMLAVAWHIYFAILVSGLLLGVRPSKRVAGILLALPLLSVSGLAWLSANPFNGIIFAVVGVALLWIAIRLPQERIDIAPMWVAGAGVFMFVFGWFYPHFLEASSWVPYLYAAPMGLIPCPTLSTILGLSLILGGLQSRSWSLVLGATGIFYGLFGAIRLGVTIDVILLLGALLIVLLVFLSKTDSPQQVLAH